MSTDVTRRTIETIWKIEAPRLIGALARMTRDVGRAEDLAQEALVAALEKWPEEGLPDNPGAWLVATGKNRALDEHRRQKMLERKHEAIGHEQADSVRPDIETQLDENVGDDLLRLVFVSCHPVLSREARVALTLRLLGGLTTDEIARAFLVPEPTISQRLVRAKRTLAEAKVPFEVPRGADLEARIASVLDVIYLIFNEGYSATRGDDWMRPALCEDAMRLGRILAGLAPNEPEVHGLVALMELTASRQRARLDEHGEPVLLLEQNRARWDRLLIDRGLKALRRSQELKTPLGPYALQASIAAVHARARSADETDWTAIVAIYDALVELTGSPVVELNRAVAVSMAFGPEQALEIVDAIADDPALRSYHLLPSVRGDLLQKLGRIPEARAELERAAFMAQNSREKALLLARAKACK